jgi:hypothetical protein
MATSATSEDRQNSLNVGLSESTVAMRPIIYRHHDLLNVYGIINQIRPFAESGLTPKELLEAKKVVWGVSPSSTPRALHPLTHGFHNR